MENAYGKGGSFILDFGKHVVGRFQIDIDSVGSPMDAPLYLEIQFVEMPCEFQYDPNASLYGSAMVNSYRHAWSCTPVYLIQKYLIQR